MNPVCWIYDHDWPARPSGVWYACKRRWCHASIVMYAKWRR